MRKIANHATSRRTAVAALAAANPAGGGRAGAGGLRGPSRLRRRCGALLSDTKGNIMPLSAVAMVMLAALVGGSVDMSRAYKVQSRLQAACDAGVLAGRRAVGANGYDSPAQQQAASYFGVNFDQGHQVTHDTKFQSSSANNGGTVSGTASTKLDMLVMKLFGNATMTVRAQCSSTMGVGNSDVTMVLDTTGSMSSTLSGTTTTRIQALRTAMKNFYTTVANATQGSNARVRYAFVPYSTSVNVGSLLYNLDPDYLVDTYAIQSRVPVYKTVTQQVFAGWGAPVYTSSSGYGSTTTSNTSKYSNTQYNTSNSCNNALPSATAWANNGSSTTSTSSATNGSGQQVVTTTTAQPQIKTSYTCQLSGNKYYVYYYYSYRTYYNYSYATSDPIYNSNTSTVFDRFDYKQVSYDVSSYKAFQAVSTNTGTNGAAVSSLWKGCIEERQTVPAASFSFSSMLGMSPDDAYDLDIDSEPGWDDATRWAPMWPEVAYYRTKLVTSGWSSSYQPTNDAVTTSGAQASSYCPYRSQALASMSQSQFNAYADALSAAGYTYHDIGMVWGARLSSPDGIFGSIVNSKPSNGGNVARHLIYMTDGEPNADNMIQQAYGIEFRDRRITNDGSSDDDARHESRFRAVCDAVKAKGIRIWVIGFTSGLTSDLSYCASANSAFIANNAGQLDAAFQEIAKQVGELRVVQ